MPVLNLSKLPKSAILVTHFFVFFSKPLLIFWAWFTTAAYNPYGLTNIYLPTLLSIGAICRVIYDNVYLLNFRRVTGLLDLGECLLMDSDILPSAVQISPVHTARPLPHHDKMMNVLYLFHLETDKLSISTVPVQNPC